VDPTLVAAGFGAYFFLLVISYMLLSNPDIDQRALKTLKARIGKLKNIGRGEQVR
jgi:hypothetical protein